MKKILFSIMMLCLFMIGVYAQPISETSESANCPSPFDLSVGHIAGSSALVTWSSNATAQNAGTFYVEYAAQGSSNWMMENTSERRVFLSGLQPQTTYNVRVFMNCSDGYSDTVVTTFTTGCLAGGPIAIGNGSLLESSLPNNAYWKYSMSQQIYTSSEMRGAATLESISFDCVISNSGPRNLSIYLMHTSQTNPTTWLPMQSALLVYSGSTNFSSSWNTINFSTPFVYNGTDNLAVIIFDNTGSYTSQNYFNAHETSNTTLYFCSDEDNVSVSNLPRSVNSMNCRLNTKFGAACNNTATCITPNVLVSDISSDAVSIMWAPGADESSWNVEYRLAGTSAWMPAGTATASPYTISNLSPMTSYEIRVSSDCGDGLSSEPVMLNVTTSCSSISTLPFTESFDALTQSENIPNCWYAGTSQQFTTPSIGSLSHSAPNSMNFDGNANQYVYLALPRLADNIDMNNLLVTFYAMRLSNLSPSFELGVMTDPNDYSTFTPISQVSPAEAGPWELMEVNTSSYVGTGHYLAFRSHCYMFVDDITVSEAPACFHVSDVTVDSVSANTVDLHWSVGALETDWDIVCDIHGFDPEEVPYETVSGSPSTNISGLLPNKYYDVYVRANCGSSQSEWMSTSFWTGCEAVEVLPYNEDFELVAGARYAYTEENNLPNCWHYLNTGMQNEFFPIVTEDPDEAASGVNSIIFSVYNTSDYGEQYAILPEINAQMNPIANLSLSFDAKRTGTAALHLAIGVMTDPSLANTFVPVDTVIVNNSAYQNFTVDFSSYEGEGNYIALKALLVANNQGYVDNVSLNYQTDCARPTSLQVTNPSWSEIALNWTLSDPDQTEWEVEYGPRGFEVGTGEGVLTMVYNDPSTTISGLADGIYDFYVRSQCGTYNWSPWFGPVSGCPNSYVMTRNSVDTLTTCSMYVFDNGGVSGHYAPISNDVLIIYPEQSDMLAQVTGNYQLDRYGDVLSIYDGVGLTGELLWESSSEQSGTGVVDVRSTMGPLTLHFTSDGNTSYDGFELLVSCVDASACVRPANLMVDNVTTNAVTLSWSSFGQESQWIVEYGPAGFAPGNGTQITVSTNPYLVQNLASNTTYDFYVRALCTATDTSDYSFAVSAATTQVLAHTPYFTDFNNAQENSLWTLVNGNQTNKWYVGQPSGYSDDVLFISNNGTDAEYTFDAPSVVWAYRDIQFNQDVPEFELSFNWKAEGESSYGVAYDFIKVYIADPVEVEAGNFFESGLTSLSERLNRNSSWQHFTVNLGGIYAGQTKRLYFVWKNDNREGDNPSAMIDSITIREVSCSTPTNLFADAITDHSANVSFFAAASSTNWQYVIGTTPLDPDQSNPINITSASIPLTNLAPETQYYIYVRTVCSSTDFSNWAGPLTFVTDTMIPVETCDMPTNISVSYITYSSADITWTPGADENAWNVQYKEVSAEEWGSDIRVGEPMVTLTGLTENTMYMVRVQAVCGEDLSSDWTIPVNFTTAQNGVNEYDLDDAISVYPNPTNGQFTIDNAQCTMSSVDVYDVYGKLIGTTKVEDSQVTLDIRTYADGVYFARIVTENGVVTKRIVKK